MRDHPPRKIFIYTLFDYRSSAILDEVLHDEINDVECDQLILFSSCWHSPLHIEWDEFYTFYASEIGVSIDMYIGLE